MPLAEYRTYSRDCTDYKALFGYTDSKIVSLLRLNMDTDLKRAVDTNYPEWNTYTVEEAVATIGNIVNQVSNIAVYRKEFNEMKQGENERVREFVTRLKSCAGDFSFVCPYDNTHDLVDYHLIDRIRSGIFDVRLQQELLQKQSTINNVQTIVQYCEDYESAIFDKNALTGSASPSIYAITTNNSDGCASHDEMVAALSLYQGTKKGYETKPDPDTGNTVGVCECCGT